MMYFASLVKKKKKNLLFEDASYGQPHFEMRAVADGTDTNVFEHGSSYFLNIFYL